MSSWQRRNYVDYFTNHQEEKLIKNVWTFFQDQSKRDKRNYDKALWYFAQASGDQIANQVTDEQNEAFDFAETVCGMSVSYQG